VSFAKSFAGRMATGVVHYTRRKSRTVGDTLRRRRDLRRSDNKPLDRMAAIRYISANIAHDNRRVRCTALVRVTELERL
jgi:hypothetical protein